MYHRIVAGRVRSLFRDISAGNYEPMIGMLAPRFVYEFYGDHALSGRRTTAASVRAWWQRIFRLIPEARFEPREILVAGWPWATTIAVSATVSTTLPDGSPYRNTINQFTHMRWGRVTEMRMLEDTLALSRALDVIAAAGNAEAHAAPITDEPAASPAA